MTSIRASIQRTTPAHEYVSVFAGPDAEHRAFCGLLTMRAEEAAELIARIEAREPGACPVASEPVELAAELARDLASGDPGYTEDGWTVVANEHIEKQRWEPLHWLVIRNDAGQHFADTYRKGLTESQDTRPYEYATKATFTPVVPTVKVSIEWKAAQKGGQS
ncbi:hypothetical protein [Nonomuraea sp. NPDC049750]|uniref:hypothetical protein n=1 Tax=Nonomuraea sp. NPDC049750 TaxID=3154738 RepID=UPI0033F7BDC7